LSMMKEIPIAEKQNRPLGPVSHSV